MKLCNENDARPPCPRCQHPMQPGTQPEGTALLWCGACGASCSAETARQQAVQQAAHPGITIRSELDLLVSRLGATPTAELGYLLQVLEQAKPETEQQAAAVSLLAVTISSAALAHAREQYLAQFGGHFAAALQALQLLAAEQQIRDASIRTVELSDGMVRVVAVNGLWTAGRTLPDALDNLAHIRERSAARRASESEPTS